MSTRGRNCALLESIRQSVTAANSNSCLARRSMNFTKAAKFP